MRIGCLQFAPEVGDVDKNLDRADSVLDAAEPEELDILVLPELAFSGYNFKSLREIAPFLEKTCGGISTSWARSAALRYDCTVVVGYPEIADVSHKWPTSPEHFNSAVIVNEEGETSGHYRKTHLYYTDETWSLEGDGFYNGHVPGAGEMALGICMDIKFEAPWDVYEFANHALKVSANLVVVSMAWLTREMASEFAKAPKEPDIETLTYWVKRMEPLIKSNSEDEIIVVFANRCGVEDDAVYAGTSAVLGIRKGEVTVYGLLGRGESKVLVVDTNEPGFAKLVYRPEDEESQSLDAGNEDSQPANHKDNPTKSQDDLEPSASNDNYDKNQSSDMNGRTIHDHVFLGPDALPQGSLTVPGGYYGESPISPRYFDDQQLDRAPMAAEFPNEGIHSSYREWRSSLNEPRAIEEVVYTPMDSEPQQDFSNHMTSLPRESAVAGGEINRQHSTRSRDTSRALNAHKDETKELNSPVRTASRAANHGTSHSRGESKSSLQEQRFRSPNINEIQSPIRTIGPRPTIPELHKMSHTPELSQVDISEMVIVEEQGDSRPKRDSLLCHVDEDDYVVMRREAVKTKGSSTKAELDERKSSGRDTPRSMGQPREGRSNSGASNNNNRIRSSSKRSEGSHRHDTTHSRSGSRSKSRQQRSESTSTAPVPPLSTSSSKKPSSRPHVQTTQLPPSSGVEESPLMAPVYRTRGSSNASSHAKNTTTKSSSLEAVGGRRSRNNSHDNVPGTPGYVESPRPSSKVKAKQIAASMNTDIPLIEQLREHRRRQGIFGSSLENSFVPHPYTGGGGSGGKRDDGSATKKKQMPPTPKALVAPNDFA